MNAIAARSNHSRWPQRWRRFGAACLLLCVGLPAGPDALAQSAAPAAAAATTPSPEPPAATEAALADAWARVLIRANPGPYQYAAYELTARGNAGVASHTLGVQGRKDAIVKTELMARSELLALFTALREAGGWALPALPPPPPATKATKPSKKAGKSKTIQPSVLAAAEADPLWTPATSAVPIYELSLRLGGVEHTILVTDPFVQRDRRYARVIGLIRDAAVRTAGAIGFPGTTGSSRAGYVYVDSVPSARVWIDGVLAQDTTPLLQWSLAPGPHAVELEWEADGKTQRKAFPVLIQAGLTTTLEVDLRD